MSSAEAWLQIARISNTPTVVSDAVAGAVLVVAAPDAGPVVQVAIAMAMLYTAGMVLNDVADAKVDRRERPERPIPAGAISPGLAIGVFCGLVGAALTLLAGQGVEPLLAGIGLVALIVVYDFWHKGNPLSPGGGGGGRAGG